MPKYRTEESKAEKFDRLLTLRLPKAQDEIRKVRRLFEGDDYEFSPQDARTVFRSLMKAVAPISPEKIRVQTVSEVVRNARPKPKEEKPPEGDFKGLTPVKVSELRWAFDMMRRGEHYEAEKMIRRVLMGVQELEGKKKAKKASRDVQRKG